VTVRLSRNNASLPGVVPTEKFLSLFFELKWPKVLTCDVHPVGDGPEKMRREFAEQRADKPGFANPYRRVPCRGFGRDWQIAERSSIKTLM